MNNILITDGDDWVRTDQETASRLVLEGIIHRCSVAWCGCELTSADIVYHPVNSIREAIEAVKKGS